MLLDQGHAKSDVRYHLPFFLVLSLTVVFGLRLTVDCFTKRPLTALRPRWLPDDFLAMFVSRFVLIFF